MLTRNTEITDLKIRLDSAKATWADQLREASHDFKAYATAWAKKGIKPTSARLRRDLTDLLNALVHLEAVEEEANASSTSRL